MLTNFILNGVIQTVDCDDDTPLLWVLRDLLEQTGTKFGCGVGVCGACTVLINDEATRSCITPITIVANQQVKTIEGLSEDGSHVIQQSWLIEQVAQCGYCQSGQIMQACSLLLSNSQPTDDDIDQAMQNNICRCGTYQRIRKAIKRTADVGNSKYKTVGKDTTKWTKKRLATGEIF